MIEVIRIVIQDSNERDSVADSRDYKESILICFEVSGALLDLQIGITND